MQEIEQNGGPCKKEEGEGSLLENRQNETLVKEGIYWDPCKNEDRLESV